MVAGLQQKRLGLDEKRKEQIMEIVMSLIGTITVVVVAFAFEVWIISKCKKEGGQE